MFVLRCTHILNESIMFEFHSFSHYRWLFGDYEVPISNIFYRSPLDIFWIVILRSTWINNFQIFPNLRFFILWNQHINYTYLFFPRTYFPGLRMMRLLNRSTWSISYLLNYLDLISICSITSSITCSGIDPLNHNTISVYVLWILSLVKSTSCPSKM